MKIDGINKNYRKSDKRNFLFLILILSSFIFIINISLISSQEISYCAEMTIEGRRCQNVPYSEVDADYRFAQTSCESTSYCKTGTCVDTSQGICMENTPKSVCEEDEGVWYDESSDKIPVCKTGCCVMGEQVAFVTQARCQNLASLYGLRIEFRENIRDEVSCISIATPSARGACVYETDRGRTCRMTTKEECNNINERGVNFYDGFLCSNPDLGADCGMTRRTTCIQGKDEVYFVDSCDNMANIYDANKVDDIEYWSYLPGTGGVQIDPGDNDGNVNSRVYGNCDYFLGSTCGPSKDSGVRPDYGDYVCKDLGCFSGPSVESFYTQYGRYPNHGETWCVSNTLPTENEGFSRLLTFNRLRKEQNLPGDRDYRLVCYNGEVTVEPCANYRQEICIEGDEDILLPGATSDVFKHASCVINRWQDCIQQLREDDCENEFQRDCVWVIGVTLAETENENTIYVYDSSLGRLIEKEIDDDYLEYGESALEGNKASCVPKYSPGFDFWNERGDSSIICSIANTQCFVKYEKRLSGEEYVATSRSSWIGRIFSKFGGWPDSKADEDEIFCLDNNGNIVSRWKTEIKNSCLALGDCGISTNYFGERGYYGDDDLFVLIEGEY